ncbi:hypothetical protein R1flu_012090 [Riccia fluitans]|uniref:Uncharacterized protein n=1 Tax=Riccia fluitans TaxID=41844 RepID=A0ABD1Z9M3_9MARC
MAPDMLLSDPPLQTLQSYWRQFLTCSIIFYTLRQNVGKTSVMEHIRDLLERITEKKPKPTTLKEFVAQHKQIMLLYPLFGMVTVGFGLAGMTAFRILAISPTVLVNKETRAADDLPEIRDPEGAAKRGKMYVETSPLYRLTKDTKIGATISKLQHEPPVLPGDESAEIGFQGTAVNRGIRGGGI